MREWYPISTAPKDGTIILAWRFFPVAVYWGGNSEFPWEAVHVGGNMRLFPNGFAEDDPHLTHWMPLPEPPEDAE
jgi:hypothetical protein